ncbi:MAG TPA: hypothetical protein VL173_11020 [Vicinamibacterales bacterium]|nr:hypothetical protein [Vicinamibacterales bacterium]
MDTTVTTINRSVPGSWLRAGVPGRRHTASRHRPPQPLYHD